MIASLRGTVIALGVDHAVIECQGVGYQILATPHTLGRLRRGEEEMVLTHLAVKEDAMTLYGFITDEERKMFLLLQTVSGLGPKLALATIGTLPPAEISAAVTKQDGKHLQTVPGVGKRMAERMLVELKDKVAEYLPVHDVDKQPEPVLSAKASTVANQVIEALVGLGFTERVAGPVVASVMDENPDLATPAALKASLAALGRA